MDEIKAIEENTINNLSGETGFNTNVLLKDYYITVILYLIKDVEGIYFKGGTALQKIFLNYARLSEDVDYTATRNIAEVIEDIQAILEKSKFFDKITKDKEVKQFTRLLAHYTNFDNKPDVVFIDLNQRATLLSPSEKHTIPHFYAGHIPVFSVPTLSQAEMVAEKMAASIGRNKPRDHFDLYKIIEKNIPINLDFVRQKLSNGELDITRMFNRAKKLKKRWDASINPLLAEPIEFVKVMTTLARHFKLKEEKEKRK